MLAGTLGFSTSEPTGNAPVGVYSVKPVGLSSPNYAITFVPGSLTIIAKALTIAANNASKTYGQPDPTFSATGSGFAPGEGLNSLTVTLQFGTSEYEPATCAGRLVRDHAVGAVVAELRHRLRAGLTDGDTGRRRRSPGRACRRSCSGHGPSRSPAWSDRTRCYRPARR